MAAMTAAISAHAENSSPATGVTVTNHAESFTETPAQRGDSDTIIALELDRPASAVPLTAVGAIAK